MIEKARGYAPTLLKQYENKARAYQLRYIARQAIRNKNGQQAVKYFHLAIKTSPSILQAETGRTLATMAAAYSLKLLPLAIYNQIESMAQSLLGRLQKAQINKELIGNQFNSGV